MDVENGVTEGRAAKSPGPVQAVFPFPGIAPQLLLLDSFDRIGEERLRICVSLIGILKLAIVGVIVALFRRIVIGNTECFQRVFVVQFMILPG